MTDLEIALELWKNLLPLSRPVSQEEQERLLALYPKCLETVRSCNGSAPKPE